MVTTLGWFYFQKQLFFPAATAGLGKYHTWGLWLDWGNTARGATAGLVYKRSMKFPLQVTSVD